MFCVLLTKAVVVCENSCETFVFAHGLCAGWAHIGGAGGILDRLMTMTDKTLPKDHVASFSSRSLPAVNPSIPEWVTTHLLETYLAHIRGSLGSKSYRHWYVHQNKDPNVAKDVTNGGQRSCGYFASAVLVVFGLAYKLRAETQGLLKDMWSHDWYEIKEPRPGAVLVWIPREAETGSYPHIGFYIGDGVAISHIGGDVCAPAEHDYNYVPPKSDHRELHSIWWHDKLV